MVAMALALMAFMVATQAESCQKATDQLNKSVTPNAAIDAQVSGLALGQSESGVIATMGKPDSTQTMQDTSGTTDELYYGQWQLTFTNSKLDSKNRY